MNRNGFIVQLRTYINTVIILCNSNIGRFLSGVRLSPPDHHTRRARDIGWLSRAS